MTFTLEDCLLYENERFVLPLPAREGWEHSCYRRSFSAGNVVCTHAGTTITATLYPKTGDGGEYRDTTQFLKATARIPPDLTWKTIRTPPIRSLQYTDGTRDRYYAVLDAGRALLELDISQKPGEPAPPYVGMLTLARVPPARPLPTFTWETIALPHFHVEVPKDWPRKDEHNRPLQAAFVKDAHGLSISYDEERYRARQKSRPQYRIEELARGKNLKSYLVGLKTERRRTSIDGASYRFLGEDTLRLRHSRGNRLRYQGYSPRGMRGPFEWYHELLLMEVGPAPLLITAYCDWIERHHYAPIFARITKSLAARADNV